MATCSAFHRWECEPDKFRALTPIGVRDMILDCFYQAQKDTYAGAKKGTAAMNTDEDLKRIVWGAVRLAFDRSQVDFCRPTREGLRRVVALLAKKASSWGTPREVVEHNLAQINKAIDALPNGKRREG